jgi:hypothetical protein
MPCGAKRRRHLLKELDSDIRDLLAAADAGEIPTAYRSKPLTKAQAAKLHSGEQQTNPTVYFKHLINKGKLSPPIGGGQRWQFDIRDFPKHVHSKMRPQSQ